ncbi:uncharacterized protein CcaverHIS019_0701570 [Cutaneotrichosporon cavernicola]|uniref:NAA35-like N-terminal domain-containing protein n=1 Tax=Cutaneotrichosporon cavernicola TaxID=279322 RepID=A0AA48L9W0_9TREE|nr:uncharacterized protein CcaverHIS019_0701570 [Cutaneotrichosporon cavernicola]BEI94585.1 hypothetical protein CcaverHIS019_0701570 [Cutaneotrichosporon cavernicola]BEJ02362.1 hypothetical protein CcaverHIS631_0701570 [Cutaneotrichosporon cavernicola]BEJ10119.1 hypothetical protein CcaverHIS641_0701540 [Cutaneotrichosporon cavernicola]
MPDIKAWLSGAAQYLPPGGVVKPVSLSNMEAMNALQMMDPQMDWGMSFAPRGRFDPGAPLTPAQVCWVMDEMGARELAWLQGGTLAQTVFTGLHYHNALEISPKARENDKTFLAAYAACAALRAFVLAYAKGVEIAWGAMCDAAGSARDGEDFWADPYGVPLETAESITDVVSYVNGVVRWLSQQEAWVPVAARLWFRLTWIAALQLQPSEDVQIPKVSTEPVDWAFDDVAALLRQNMPLPNLSFPSHDEMWAAFHDAVAQLAAARALADTPVADIERHLASMPETLPIVRAQYRALLGTLDRDALVDEWLSDATSQPRGVLDRLGHEVQTPNDRRSFALWRDIVAGNFFLGLTVRLQNPPRRRRGLQHLSRAWCDQASSASRLATRCPAFKPIVAALRARALDADLSAALAALSLRLLSRHERRAHWWWIARVAGARLALSEVRGEWAKAWAAVANGMLILYTLVPTGDPSYPEFVLRNKIALGTGSHPAPPLFNAWEASKDALDDTYKSDAKKGRTTALAWLRTAHRLMDTLDVRPLQCDLAGTIATLESGRELHWEKDGAAEVAERIPRLQ